MTDEQDKGSVGGPAAEATMTPEELFAIQAKLRNKLARQARRREESESAFSITSLMDALVIILVFLLVTLSSDPLNIKQDAHLLLARSTTPLSPEDAIPISIKKGFISVDQKEVVRVDCSMGAGRSCGEEQIQRRTYCDVNPSECSPEEMKLLDSMYFYIDKTYKEDGDENSFLIMPLMATLEDKVKQQQDENRELQREFKGIVNIICDRDIPFRLLAEVVHTAGTAGLSNMRFAVIKSVTR
ncbi:MAG: hypothetical protein GXP54_00305 [Deltaproteobacteria bacterium]|nr:hypothetical protein [Deltaproteobacteria bacterium]